MFYLDNAATTYPKPEAVYAAINTFLRASAGNPGRSGHRLALAAQSVVDDARAQVAALFNAPDPSRVVFTLNATDALNMALKGVLCPGDHAITTTMEHNAVLRPLTRLAREGVQVTWVPADASGLVDPAQVAASIRPNTRLVVLTHASNVCGAIQPVAQIAAIARAHGLLCLVDAAQTAGAIPIDVRAIPVDLVAFAGHKSLFGPPGTGGLWVGERAQVNSLREGGTGSASESPEQPDELPARLEAGTCNSVGLAGLAAGARFIRELGVDTIRAHERRLTHMLWDGLSTIRGVRLYGPSDPAIRTSALCFTLDHLEPADIAAILDSSFDIAARSGLHCAPLAHRTLGTLPHGTVRLSCGYFTTTDHVQQAVKAVAAIAHA